MGRERTTTGPGNLREETKALVELHRAQRVTALVTVAEVNGDAAALGVGLLALCDVAVAVSTARFAFPEVGIDLAPAIVLAWLPRMVGRREAFWLTATGERITAARAQDLGLINEVVSGPEALEQTVTARVAALRAHNPRVHSEIKEMLRTADSLSEEQALEASVDRLVVASLRRGESVSRTLCRHRWRRVFPGAVSERGPRPAHPASSSVS
jgi:enoyl-CoA hydratase/carnithine racemase